MNCFANAVARALNIKVTEIYEFLGHDGQEIIDSESPEPYCRRAFHEREMIDFCLSKNYAMIPFDRKMLSTTCNDFSRIFETKYPNQETNFWKTLFNHNVIVTGNFPRPHAIYCSQGIVYDLNQIRLEEFLRLYGDAIERFYVIKSF